MADDSTGASGADALLLAQRLNSANGGGGGGVMGTTGGAVFWLLPGVQINAFSLMPGAIRTQNSVIAAIAFGKSGGIGDKLLKILEEIYEDFSKMNKSVSFGGSASIAGISAASSGAPSATHGSGVELG